MADVQTPESCVPMCSPPAPHLGVTGTQELDLDYMAAVKPVNMYATFVKPPIADWPGRLSLSAPTGSEANCALSDGQNDVSAAILRRAIIVHRTELLHSSSVARMAENMAPVRDGDTAHEAPIGVLHSRFARPSDLRVASGIIPTEPRLFLAWPSASGSTSCPPHPQASGPHLMGLSTGPFAQVHHHFRLAQAKGSSRLPLHGDAAAARLTKLHWLIIPDPVWPLPHAERQTSVSEDGINHWPWGW
ncbi:hypothetical protein JX265_003419 [Neoarthrinium moseri]|uniref:Uncharacterized protein n=1 Tax=Neoarthrinium moseri TaxID=1658444 RepID=A0A9P9WS54_9PEZI|nr:hypothetical protein JX265_003419 [Neoarthrinium moseri]